VTKWENEKKGDKTRFKNRNFMSERSPRMRIPKRGREAENLWHFFSLFYFIALSSVFPALDKREMLENKLMLPHKFCDKKDEEKLLLNLFVHIWDKCLLQMLEIVLQPTQNLLTLLS
jgi:hypothetical protein